MLKLKRVYDPVSHTDGTRVRRAPVAPRPLESKAAGERVAQGCGAWH